jgi:hyperosmotically inducible protein
MFAPMLRRLEMMIRTTVLGVLACGAILGAAGCDNRGPAEKAGEKVDHTVDTIKNGGHEPVGDSIKDDVNKARDKVSDAVDDAKK